jgi:hypothetical protein
MDGIITYFARQYLTPAIPFFQQPWHNNPPAPFMNNWTVFEPHLYFPPPA